MEARVHQSPAEFRDVVLPLLSADPVLHTIALTGVERQDPDALMITLHDNENLVGMVIQVLPYAMVVSAMPIEAAGVIAKAVRTARPELSAAHGPVKTVEAFTAAWTELTGAKAGLTYSQRLFELGDLQPPAVDGKARQGTEDDLKLLTRWRELFGKDVHIDSLTRARAIEDAQRSLTPGNVNFLWEADGKQVALAAARGPIAGMVRIAPVYTPPEHRGHGYASAITAAVSQWALDEGAEHVLLYTDLANEITNRIYPRLGYRAVADFAEYSFS